ncbi:MAG: transporter substrate-binding domain-containing protein [Opitutaceae bacterium]
MPKLALLILVWSVTAGSLLAQETREQAAHPAAPPGAVRVDPTPTAVRRLRVGVEIQAAPTMFAGPSGEALGFAPDLLRAVASSSGLDITFVVASWESIHSAFKAGEIDVLAHVVKTPERESYMDFAVSHLTMEGAIFTKIGDHRISTLDDLTRVRVGVQSESFTHLYLRRKGYDRSPVFYPTLQTAFVGLADGRCDAVIAVRLIGNKIIREEKLGTLEALAVAVPEVAFKMHMAVHEGDAATLARLNDGLAAIRADGTYDRVYEQWIGPLERRQLRWRDVAPFVIPLGVALGCALIAFAWQRRLLSRLSRQAADLQESRQQLALVLEASQDGFWDWDVSRGQVERSARWLEVLGLPASQSLQDMNGSGERVHPDDQTSYRRALEDLLHPLSPPYSRFEYRIRDAHGNWRWMLDRAKVVSRDANGRPTRIVGTGSDINVRKRTEEALQRSEALLRQSQEAAGIGGWEIDVESDTLYWTYETYRIHDIDTPRSSPTLEEFLRFYTETSQATIRQAIALAKSEGQPFDVELDLTTAKSRLVWVRMVGRVMRGERGRIAKVYGSFQDITARKAAEAEREDFQRKLLETQKLESLGVLAGGVAHDFNNLLTAILANAELARLFTDAGTELDEYLQSIAKASLRAADLCRQLLAYAGRSPTSTQTTRLNDLIHETVQLLGLTLGKNARLELDLDPQLPPVEADPGQINQVLMNLVINASEALPTQGGLIRVRTGTQWLTPEMLAGACIGQDLPPGDYRFIEVSDTGCGMSPETIARIFDPFFTTKFTGRGLGLAAVLGIVRAHRGGFFVESTLGQGSTFRMCLPGAGPSSAPEVPKPAMEAPKDPLQQKHILVVDDEEAVRTVTAELLRSAGCTVVTAADGNRGLDLFREKPTAFDAVVLDMTMPGLDGPATFMEMRALVSDVRVLLMSGYSEREATLVNLPVAPNSFLRKPFTRIDLLEKLSSVFTSRS